MTDRDRPAEKPEPGESLLGVPPAPAWLTDREHPDACGTCHHPHVYGRSGTCSKFTCPCKTWTPPE